MISTQSRENDKCESSLFRSKLYWQF